jgi:hypothetical protein
LPLPAGYTLLDDTWKTAGGTAFDAATGYTSSMTFVRKQGQNHAISLPDTVTLVSGMRGTAGAYYVVEGQTEPVVFTVAAPDGMAVKAVTATIGSGTAQTLTAANNQYSIPASSLTGNLTVAVETEISLTTANVKSFISGDAFAPYCAYSGSDTLVLFKLALPADKQGVLLSGEGLPTVYALDAETEPYGDYNFAVLLPASTFSAVSNQAVTDYLQAKLIFTDSVNTTVTYDYNTNGKTGANVIDAGAAYDFSALQSGAAWHWAPTDDLLLKADVLNYTDSSYTLGTANANGTVDANDISVFLYTYAHFPKPVD